MSEQGTRFKTGFLAPNIDYGAIGQGVAASFANPILAVAQERAAQRDAKMKALNPQAAAGEAVPGQINQKYQGAAQMALDIYQEAATNFELDPSGANEKAFVQAKNQYLSIVQDAKFGTEFIAKKTAEIKGNTELAESGLLDANINAITEYAMPPIYTRQGNVVMVGQGANAIDYFNSGITASNADNLFYETGSIVGDYKFLGSAVGKEVFNSQFATKKGLSASQGGYQETQVIQGISQPVVIGFDEEGFSADVADQYNVFASNNRTMWNAASMEGYKFMYAGNRDLQSGDLESINNTMHPELFSLRNSNGVSISKVTGFEPDGTPIYAISIEDIEAGIKSGEMQFIDPTTNMPTQLPPGITMDEINNFRNGETVHAREYYNTIRGQFPQVDEDAVAEMLSGVTTGPTGLTRTIFTAYNADDEPAADPTLANAYPNKNVGSIASGGNFKKVTVSNVQIDVEKAIVDLSTGQVIGYKIAKDQELIDRLTNMQNRSQSQTDLLALLTEEADIYVNSETDSAAFTNIQQQLEGQEKTGKASTYNTLLAQAISQLGSSIQAQAQGQANSNVNNLNQGAGGGNQNNNAQGGKIKMDEGGLITGGTNGDDETNGDQKGNGDQKEKEESEDLELVVNPNMRFNPVSGKMEEITEEEAKDELIERAKEDQLDILPGKEAGPIDTGVETPNLLTEIISYNEPTRKEKRREKRRKKRDDKDIAKMTKQLGGQEVIDEFERKTEEALAEKVARELEQNQFEIEAEARRIEEEKARVADGLTASDEKIAEFMGGYLQGLVPNPFNPDEKNQEPYANAELLVEGSDTYEFDLANMILRFGMPGEGTKHYEAAQALDINKYGITTAEAGATIPNTSTLINRGAPLSDFVDFNDSKEDQAMSLLSNIIDFGSIEDDIVDTIKEMFKVSLSTSGQIESDPDFKSWWGKAVVSSKAKYDDPVPPWCAAFIADLLIEAGQEEEVPEGWGAIRARNYTQIGTNVFDNVGMVLGSNVQQEQLSDARIGDVVVKGKWGSKTEIIGYEDLPDGTPGTEDNGATPIEKTSWSYQQHVGLFAGFTQDRDGNDMIMLIGGNQADQVKISTYPIIEQTVVGYKDLPDGTKGTKDNGAKPIIRNGGVESIRRVSAPLLNPAEAEAISTLIVARGGETEILEESTR